MTTAELLKFIQNWAVRFENRLTELSDSLHTRVGGMQRELVQRLLVEMAAILEWKDGKIVAGSKNMAKIRRIEKMFDGFVGDVGMPELQLFAGELLEVGSGTVGYFQATNEKMNEAEVKKALAMIRELIGINEHGYLIAGGFIDRLSVMQPVRKAIREYVVKSIVGKVSLAAFQRGFRELVEGSKDTDGLLQRYWRQYTYDTYNTVHEVVNSTVAGDLGLKYFIYQGSVIPTTREFCRARSGKVFSVAETKDWKNDPNLIDKATKDLYVPLVDRGRYNCRHFINYISNELAFELRPELKK